MNETEKLKRVLKEKGISQERAARDIGVSIRTLFRWIHGQHQPNELGKKAILNYLRKL